MFVIPASTVRICGDGVMSYIGNEVQSSYNVNQICC